MYARLDGPSLASDAILAPQTYIQYFPLSPKLALSPVKEHLYFMFAQLSGLFLHLGLKVLAFHHLQWPCPCSDTEAAVISKRFQGLSLSCFLREEAIGFLMHM
jgi:hypothetical protein